MIFYRKSNLEILLYQLLWKEAHLLIISQKRKCMHFENTTKLYMKSWKRLKCFQFFLEFNFFNFCTLSNTNITTLYGRWCCNFALSCCWTHHHRLLNRFLNRLWWSLLHALLNGLLDATFQAAFLFNWTCCGLFNAHLDTYIYLFSNWYIYIYFMHRFIFMQYIGQGEEINNNKRPIIRLYSKNI